MSGDEVSAVNMASIGADILRIRFDDAGIRTHWSKNWTQLMSASKLFVEHGRQSITHCCTPIMCAERTSGPRKRHKLDRQSGGIGFASC